MRSMTGFGRGEATFERPGAVATIVVEVRSVNQRHLDVRVNADDELADFARLVEDTLRKGGGRGRFDARLKVQGSLAAAPTLDKERVRAAYEELSALRDELAPGDPVPLSLLAAVPGLFQSDASVDSDVLSEAVREAAKAAFAEFDSMRIQEGKALRADLLQNLERARSRVDQISTHVPELVARSRTRLRERLQLFIDERLPQLDEARLEMEVALLADKADVAEEITRLASHMEQFLAFTSEDGPVGRKLDFLLQEMGREANTIGSKIQDSDLTPLVVELKSCMQRLREQVQNVL